MDANRPRGAELRHSKLTLTWEALNWEAERSGRWVETLAQSELAEEASSRPRTYRARTWSRSSSSAGVRSANATKSCKSLPGSN